ncbi:hypothetical protein Tco_0936807 [Tanacetum coccineum]|uniref:MAK10-like protein n=1 Tax=Tanacetum coccineum TaxID=301880 RepID=A0ABQ5DDD3_9ASTR
MGGSYYPILCLIFSTGKDRKTPQRYPDVPTTSWIIYIQSMDSFQGLTPKSPSSWHRPLAPSLNFYDHVNPITRRTIDQSAGGKLRDLNAEESWALLEDLALYDNESWNDPKDFAKPVKEIASPQDVLINKITTSCEIYSGPHDTQYFMENPEQAFVEYASSRTDEAGGMLPNDTVKNPKLGTHPVSSAHSYPTIDPQCSSHPSNSINAIKTHFKEATISQTSLRQPEIETNPPQLEEPKPTLEDEFQDLHLNLLVLEVLARHLSKEKYL